MTGPIVQMPVVGVNPWFAGQQQGDVSALGEALSGVAAALRAQQQSQAEQAALAAQVQVQQQNAQLRAQELEVQREEVRLRQQEVRERMQAQKLAAASRESGARAFQRTVAPPSRVTMAPNQVLPGGVDMTVPQAVSPEQAIQGLDAEGLGAFFAAAEQLRNLQPKGGGGEQPTSAKEFMFYMRLAETNPGLAAQYESWVNRPRQPGVTVNLPSNKGESKFIEKVGEGVGGMLVDKKGTAQGLLRSFSRLRDVSGLIDRAFTGRGANALTQLSKGLRTLGINIDGTKVEDTETLVNLMRRETLDLLATKALGSGTGISEKDLLFAQQTSGTDPTLDATTIKRIVATNLRAKALEIEDYLKGVQAARDTYGAAAELKVLDIPGATEQMQRMRALADLLWQDPELRQQRYQELGIPTPGAR